VRLLKTELSLSEVMPKMQEFLNEIFKNVPSGVGVGAKIKLNKDEMRDVLEKGAAWAVDKGYGRKEDLDVLEENGGMEADSSVIGEKSLTRGAAQMGCLGAGNHFLEVQAVDKILNKDVAHTFGVEREGQVMLMIHTGSRGFGHQVCTDYLREMENKNRDLIKTLPDRELIYAKAGTDMAHKYFEAMKCAANFAWCNRQMIVHWVRESFEKVYGQYTLDIVYDVAHNIAKLEEHNIDGDKKMCYVHRKGATRAFPAGHKDVPAKYRDVGQPVIIPGDMGTASYVMVGKPKAMELSFGSTAHGAGRRLSRTAAIKRFWGKTIAKELWNKGIMVKAASWKVVAEEAPKAYKDIDKVVEVTEKAGISDRVARLVPVGVVKG
jgi:tRNA-splicing ligase RtcB